MTISSVSAEFALQHQYVINSIQSGDDRQIRSAVIALLHLALQEHKRFKILVLDQFASISPYELANGSPVSFEELCKQALRGEYTSPGRYYRQVPEIVYASEAFRPQFGTSTFRAGEDGRAEIWLYRWDSSG